MPLLTAKFSGGMKALLQDDRAATAIEYAMIAAATCSVLAVATGALEDSPLWGVFQMISDQINELTSQ